MAQIRQVVSEALQAKIRNLLPSQQGFTEDLQASNVIMPVIDLTEAAEGSAVRQDLQSALAFGSQTSVSVYNTTSTIINTTGFYRVTGVMTTGGNGGTAGSCTLRLKNGATTKNIYSFFSISHAAGQDSSQQNTIDLVIFLSTGDSLEGTTNAQATMNVTYRQIADINGNLVNPSGFSPS